MMIFVWNDIEIGYVVGQIPIPMVLAYSLLNGFLPARHGIDQVSSGCIEWAEHRVCDRILDIGPRSVTSRPFVAFVGNIGQVPFRSHLEEQRAFEVAQVAALIFFRNG